jgi:hypothetical protein
MQQVPSVLHGGAEDSRLLGDGGAVPETVQDEVIEYVHISQNEVEAAAGTYGVEERVLEYQGRRVLYVHSEACGPVVSCCGSGGCVSGSSVFVKGWVIEWKKQSEDGQLVSKLEPIGDAETQREIKEILKSKYQTAIIYF